MKLKQAETFLVCTFGDEVFLTKNRSDRRIEREITQSKRKL